MGLIILKMKYMLTKTFFFISLVVAITSCGSNNTSSPEQSATTAATETNDEDISNIEMFKSTDCATCHRKSEAFTGPSFTEIAMRYPNAADTTINTLALTIINGSSGKWKNSVAAMTAHPALPKAEAESMVKYILQVKK